MQLIYATVRAGHLKFAAASTPLALPPGSWVYAVCDGTSVSERLDSEALGSLSELEYLTLKQMVDDAWRQESRQARAIADSRSLFGRFVQWLSGNLTAWRSNEVQAY